ncbi:MAG: hypothetical protein IPL32_05760 [Chloracidobacterium sp.]|nr:hypothetical protein [Chloracidobacterium sp.]
MKRSGEISTKQQKLIALLLTERTIDEACKKANVAVTTYWRWMQDQRFLAQYRTARRGILENTIAKLQSIVFAAIETLERNLNCENPAVEIRCAAIILEQSIKGVEMLEIEGRLEMLESLVAYKKEKDE